MRQEQERCYKGKPSLALYAQTHSEDVIYIHDLTKNTNEKIDYSFNLYSGTKYLAFLKFDKKPRV
jgi:hypothetical protein